MNAVRLPDTWLLTELGAVVDYGKTTKVESDEISALTWVLELEDIEKDTSRVVARLTQAERQSKSTKNRFDPGDVLYGKLRPYLNKVVIADASGCCTTEIVPLKAGAELDNRYLFYWLKHPDFLAFVEAESHGLNMPRLGTETGRAAPFVLAPRNEQTRIADKLDAVLARVDACRDRLHRIPTILKRFRQSVLAAATSGKLTVNLTVPPAKTAPWTAGKLGDLLDGNPRNGYSPRAVDKVTPVKSLTLTATTTGRLMPQHFKYLDEPIAPDSHLWLQPNDILIQRANSLEYVGTSAMYNDAPSGFIYPDLMMKARANSRVLPPYLLLILKSDAVRNHFRANATGTAGNMPKINQQTVLSAPARWPSLPEQTEIVRRVESLFAFADRLEARYAAACAQVKNLTPATLAKAFRGELVPQDPNDEPASVLLERIRAKRGDSAADNPKRGRKSPQARNHEETPCRPNCI